MGKVKIKRDDKARILLTELLPYEVPMLFFNEGFYSIITNGNYSDYFDRIIEVSKASSDKEGRKYSIPFNYEIRKSSEGETRTLSVIHPCCQYYFIELYEKYDSLMLHLCSKSPFSLRRISGVAKFYYSPEFVYPEDSHRSAELEVEPEVLDEETKYLKSYFKYHPIDLIFKFYERPEFQRLEQRFNHLLAFDISKCFYHIYTHSLTWAIKGKENAKLNSRAQSFENTFDKVMQLANYNETNGIVVGSEIARIFAEIILQQIDVNVLLKLERNFKCGVDFEIKRYVDDYFVYSNDEALLLKIKQIYQKELAFYKLYLNPNKEGVKSSPFVTDMTVGKRELKYLLSDLFKGLILKSEKVSSPTKVDLIKSIKFIRSPSGVSQNFIKDFQCIVKRNGLTYDTLSKDVIRFMKGQLSKILKDKEISKEKAVFENFLLMFFDILFYSYSLNVNANTTFSVSQIIILVCKFLEGEDAGLRHSIYSKILNEADFVLTNLKRKSKHSETNIETLNLLIALKKMDEGFLFSEQRIKEMFGLEIAIDFNKLNYFQIVTLLYYIEAKDAYRSLKSELEKTVVHRFLEDEDSFTKAELTFLFFDFICCPFVSLASKRKIIRGSNYCNKEASNVTVDALIAKIEAPIKWFMDWDTEIDLERVVKKKEWGSSY